MENNEYANEKQWKYEWINIFLLLSGCYEDMTQVPNSKSQEN